MTAVESLFGDHRSVRARAVFAGQRLELRGLEGFETLATGPLLLNVADTGAAVLFRYGAVVLFNLSDEAAAAFLEALEERVKAAFDAPEDEEVDLILDGMDGIVQGEVHLSAWDSVRVQIVADALAKSVVLAHYEEQLGSYLERVEPLAVALQEGSRLPSTSRELLRHVGDALVAEAKMIGRVEVSEKPELTWEHPEYERLYMRLADEYELRERHHALERKLTLISRTAETVLTLLYNRRSLRVEWYIVVLILLEIAITVAEKLY